VAGVLGGRGEHVGDQRHVGGAEVLAQHACLLGALDELGDHRAHLLAGVGHPVLAVGGEHHELPQADAGRHGLGRVLQVGDERLPRVGRREGLFRDGHHGVDAVREQLGDEGLLVGEPAVDGADADAGLAGDVVQGGLKAALGEHLGGGEQDALPVPLGIAAQRPLASAAAGCHNAVRCHVL